MAATVRPLRETTAAGWWFLAPALTLIGLFFFVPVIAALVLSFTDYDIYALGDASNTRWVAFDNYLRLLQTPLFWQALKNTFYFALVGGPLIAMLSFAPADAESSINTDATALIARQLAEQKLESRVRFGRYQSA